MAHPRIRLTARGVSDASEFIEQRTLARDVRAGGVAD
jgi:hypothetical protein